ncbi:MAG: thiol oxidoreductase, partial [Xanthomonadaceae bacterium]|nr:thiol oxidoreductase [Xanthomonadaceae bacterium]
MNTGLALPLALACALTIAICGCRSKASAPQEALLALNSGGAMTVRSSDRHAFSRPAPNLDVERRAAFSIGNAFFNSPWIVAPATADARDGLGPLFNARSCDACHNNDGRGRPPEQSEKPVSLVIQFATPTPGMNNEPGADPRYGINLNPFAIGGVPAEGTIRIRHREIRGTFADGEPYTLLAPEYEFEDLAYGELRDGTGFSPRVA